MMPDTDPIRPTGPLVRPNSRSLTVRKLDGKSLVHMDEMHIDGDPDPRLS